MSVASNAKHLDFGGYRFTISRPHSFGLVIEGFADGGQSDYLHDVLLTPENRDDFFDLIDEEGLVVCRHLQTNADSYRRVKGKSSHGKLSQAEYYHHDGCSLPTNPRVVEIRMPHQSVSRNIHTAVARFPDIVKSMLMALPKHLLVDSQFADELKSFSSGPESYPPPESWDKIQGQVTRSVRREMDAESCREYFRQVDSLADAYALPWEMGESRLMVNHHQDLSRTMQHRRAYQKPRLANEQNGSLVKRWTAEETG